MAADDLRKRVDLFGKTLAGIATLGTTAVGLSKIGDLFPDKGRWGWVVGACAGLAVAGLAAIWVAVRLMRVARPVFLAEDSLSVSEQPVEGLDKDERSAIKPVYTQAAERFRYTSLPGLAERERALRRTASQATGTEERARRIALADEVKTEIEQALARAQLVVIRRRASCAIGDWKAFLLYFAVIAGLIFFAIGADIVSSDRRDPIADAKACADARKAKATAGELGRTNKICDAQAEAPAPTAKPPSAAEARADIVGKLAPVLSACAALITKPNDSTSGPLKDKDCEAVRRAVAEMSSSSP